MASKDTTDELLRIEELTVTYSTSKSFLQRNRKSTPAVDGVSLTVGAGRTVALVGESGSGKSSVARTIVGLNRATSGHVWFDGRDLTRATPREWREARRDVQMVFQDPFASLNPRMTVAELLTEPWRVNREAYPQRSWKSDLAELMSQVGLDPEHARRYPPQFSGGQRQRICIARALALRPKLLVCDEAVSALDVSIQAQILNLLKDLQKELGLAYLFISHDLGVVRHISDEVVVMHRGRVVESGDAEQIYTNPQDPYTRALLSAEPSLHPWDEVEIAH
jgi:oligopeptide transport system ATP-binding protein